jgi:hypothetical protein
MYDRHQNEGLAVAADKRPRRAPAPRKVTFSWRRALRDIEVACGAAATRLPAR